jgi:hypothetical protein
MLEDINNGPQRVREWTELTSLFLCFAGAAIVWGGLAVYSWRVAESASSLPQDIVTVDPISVGMHRA